VRAGRAILTDMADRAARVLWALDFFRNYGRLPGGFLADDFEVHHHAKSPAGAVEVFAGSDALRAALSEIAAAFDQVALEPDEPVEEPDGTVELEVSMLGRERDSGIDVEKRYSWLWTFEGEAAVRLQVVENSDDSGGGGGSPR
jgi:ketosteroid isomerase-like protein